MDPQGKPVLHPPATPHLPHRASRIATPCKTTDEKTAVRKGRGRIEAACHEPLHFPRHQSEPPSRPLTAAPIRRIGRSSTISPLPARRLQQCMRLLAVPGNATRQTPPPHTITSLPVTPSRLSTSRPYPPHTPSRHAHHHILPPLRSLADRASSARASARSTSFEQSRPSYFQRSTSSHTVPLSRQSFDTHRPARPRAHIVSQLSATVADCSSLLAAQHRARWLLGLSRKARAIHFSREEQARILLAGATSDLVLDVADRALQHIRQQRRSSLLSRQPSSSFSTSTFSDLDDSDDSSIASTCVQESWTACTSLIDEYHRQNTASEMLSCYSDPDRRPRAKPSAFRNTLSAPMAASSTPSARSSLDSSRATRNGSRLHKRGRPETPITIVEAHESPSKYYQDPEARHKLKTYLASSQKFEEALEYGFPVSYAAHSPDLSNPPLDRPATASAAAISDAESDATNSTANTRSSTSALVASNDDDAAAAAAAVSASSLPSAVHHVPSVVRSTSAAQTGRDSVQVMREPREMTMKLSLTRPDLRIDTLPSTPATPVLLGAEQAPAAQGRHAVAVHVPKGAVREVTVRRRTGSAPSPVEAGPAAASPGAATPLPGHVSAEVSDGDVEGEESFSSNQPEGRSRRLWRRMGLGGSRK